MTDDVVVSREWLEAHRDEVTIVDVRDAWEYDGIGHVPGAVNVPFDRFRAGEHAAEAGEGDPATGDDAVGMLPGEDVWADLMAEAGISNGDTLVAYDDTHGVFAARFLITAMLYGHEHWHLLDGDYSAWTREYETTTEAPDVDPGEYTVQRPAETPLVTMADVEAAMDDPDAVLLDTRDDWEYAEGHIPGAVNLDWKELVDDETRGLKPRADLEAILADHGVTPDRRVVLYCNTARRISHTYLVLCHLGYEDLAFYEGSLTEWEAAGGPVETAETE